jgi:KAP family P-loop domain
VAVGSQIDERLSSSSRVALDWASWFAARRSAGEPASATSYVAKSSPTASGSVADSLDLLLGVLFAHPDRSEPLQLLDHFGIPLGNLQAALPADRKVDSIALPRAAPPRDPEVELFQLEGTLTLANELAERTHADQGLTRVSDLFGAMIQNANDPAAALLDRLLDEHGAPVRLAILAGEYDQFLLGLPSLTYSDFLAQNHPSTSRAQSIAGYNADAVLPATDGRDPELPEPPPPADFVGIGPEVDAFAYLVAARALIPPLAIGLFGDWGSGKSFFMQALQRRVNQITEAARREDTPQRDLPIHKSVVQIQFNAWHYVEGNLWASLVEHIFSNLRTSPKEHPDILQQRRQAVTEKIVSAELERKRVALEIGAEERRLAAAEEARKELEARQLQARKNYDDRAKAIASELAASLGDDVRTMLKRLGYSDVDASVGDFATALDDARHVLQRGTGLAAGLRAGGPLWVLAIIGVVLLGPIASLLLGGFPVVTNVLGSIATVLGGATLLLKTSSSWTSTQLDKIEKAQEKVFAKQRALDAEKLEAEKEVASIQADLRAKQDLEQSLTARISDLKREHDSITPEKILSDFIEARVGSDDYRRHLGLTALVRRDFEDLWRLIAKEEADFLATDEGRGVDVDARGAGPGQMSRIVLYIDDLDRCPPRVVVNVLQAIHLLLAFPLFVVVVAVDARWLSGSLQKHYGELLGRPRFGGGGPGTMFPPTASGDGQATPNDYLEKIFQVPFRVRALDTASRSRIVQGLVAPSLVVEHTTAGAGAADRDASSGPQDPALAELARRLFREEEAPNLHPKSLEITPRESAFMQALAPLLGDSPRAVKRFVNVYRLVKSLAEREDPDFTADIPQASYQLVLFLLAVVTGMPGFSGELFPEIAQPHPDRLTLGALALSMATLRPVEGAALKSWLDSVEGNWGDVKLADLSRWSGKISRFTFQEDVW